jgi:hypothetical protein
VEERKIEMTSLNELEGLEFKITTDPRVTRVGRFLLKTGDIAYIRHYWDLSLEPHRVTNGFNN